MRMTTTTLLVVLAPLLTLCVQGQTCPSFPASYSGGDGFFFRTACDPEALAPALDVASLAPTLTPVDVAVEPFLGPGPQHVMIASSGASPELGLSQNTGFGLSWSYAAVAALSANPRLLTAADWNGDGLMDAGVVLDGSPSNALAVYLNGGGGSFAPSPSPVPSPAGLADITVAVAADVDGDSDMDWILADAAAGVVWLDNADGAAGFTVFHTVMSDPVSDIAVADVAGNGAPLDIVTITANVNVLRFLNNGTGAFGSPFELIMPVVVGAEINAADLNGDGIVDFVTSQAVDEKAWTILSDPTGPYTAKIFDPAFASSGRRGLVAIGDLDNDGDLDLVTNSQGSILATYFNYGNDIFSQGSALTLSDPTLYARIHIKDVTGLPGGSGDVIVITNTGSVKLLINFAVTPGFFPPVTIGAFPVPTQPNVVIAMDRDNSGSTDFIYNFGNTLSGVSYDASSTTHLASIIDPSTTAFGTVQAAVVADVDSDGDPDLAVLDDSGVLLLYYNDDGEGTNTNGDGIIVGGASTLTDPTSLVAADVTGNGLVDFVVADGSTARVFLMVATAPRVFTTPSGPIATLGAAATAITVADVSGAGTGDIVVGTAQGVVVLTNSNGDGSAWAAGPLLSLGSGSWTRLYARDMDVDGTPDIVYLYSNGDVGWFRGTGTALTSSPSVLVAATSASAASFQVDDVNRDGLMDFAVRDATTVQLWMATAVGTYAAPVTPFTATVVAGAFVLHDIDHDGDLDLVVSGDSTVSVVARAETTAFTSYRPKTLTASGPLSQAARHDPASPCFAFGPNGGASVMCMSYLARLASYCVRDTVELFPGLTYGVCPVQRHIVIEHQVELKGATGGTVIDCSSSPVSVLFEVVQWEDASTPLVSAGGLVLRDLTIRGMSFASTQTLGSPGLRVIGAETYIHLVDTVLDGCDTTVVSGFDTVQDGGGGCILARSGGGVVLSDSRILGGTAGEGANGGAIAASGIGSFVCLSGSTVSGSTATGSGGAVFATQGAAAYLYAGSILEDNVANALGGGVYLASNSELVMDGAGVGVRNNRAEQSGGGVAAAEATLVTLRSGAAVSGNSAGQHGGGVFVAAEVNMTVTGPVTLSGNTAVSVGGGLAVVSSALVELNNAVLDGNSASGLGGGIAVLDPGALDLLVNLASSVDVPATTGTHDPGLAGLATVELTNTQLTNNAGRLGGSAALLCGGHLRVAGPATTWTLGSTVHSCLPPGGRLAPPYAGSDVPWMVVAPEASAVSSAVVRESPPRTVSWASQPSPEAAPGIELDGTVVILDWFGTPMSDSRLRLRVSQTTAPNPGVELVGSTVTLALSPTVTLPQASFLVADTTVLPLEGIEVTAGLDAGDGVFAADLTLTVPLTLGLCPPGYGGVALPSGFRCSICSGETFSTQPSLDPCAVCPPNSAVGVSNTTSGCTCIPGFYAVGQLCEPCPTGAVCAGGGAVPVAAPGFFPGSSPSQFLACPNPEACSGSGQCQTGYRARLCAECADGFYALNGKCFSCSSSLNALIVLIVLLVVFAFIVAVMAFNLAESLSYKFAAAMISLNGLQISALYGRLEVADWGDFADAYFEVASALNLNFELTSPECSALPGTDVWVLKYLLTLLLPVFAAIAVAAVAVLIFAPLIKLNVGFLGSKTGGQLLDASKRAWYQLMVLLYMPLCAGAFSLFGCRKDATGRWVLAAAPARSCFTSTWWGLFAPAVFGVVVYAFGLPASVIFVLHRERSRLDELNMILRYGFLVGRFRDQGWWYEAGIMGRKLGVVVCMTFFWADATKASAAVVVLVAALFHLGMMTPYRSNLHNGLAIIVLGAVALVLFGGTVADNNFRATAVVTGILVNILAMIVGNALDLHRIAKGEKDAEDEFFVPDMLHTNQSLDTPPIDAGVPGTMTSSVELGVLDGASGAGQAQVSSVEVLTPESSTMFDSTSQIGSSQIGSSVAQAQPSRPQRPSRPSRPSRPPRPNGT